MGRPINNKSFGNTTGSNLAIQFTSCWLPGESSAVSNAYVVKQTGPSSYLAMNPTSGNVGEVTLAASASAAGLAVIAVTQAGPGSGAVVTALMAASHSAIVAGGTTYSTGDTVTLVGGTGTAATFTVTASSGVVTALTPVQGGVYSVLPTGTLSTTTTGSGTGLTISVTNYKVASFAVGNGGSLYVNATLQLPGTATGSLTISGGSVTAAAVTFAGDLYTSIPTCVVAPTGVTQHAEKIMAVRVITFEGGEFSWKTDGTAPDTSFVALPLV